MSARYTKIEWDIEQLWKGCVLAGIAHAIMVSYYPEMSNEQSWDDLNYSVQDSMGQRGTISFKENYCVAVFRNDNSERINKALRAEEYFQGASKEIIELANIETLQYLLDEVEGETRPFITTAFWGKDELYSNDSFENMLVNGGNLLRYQVLDTEKAIGAWKETYDMNVEQIQLLKFIYKRKVSGFNESLTLSRQEIDLLNTSDEDGLEESKLSFEEMGIYWC